MHPVWTRSAQNESFATHRTFSSDSIPNGAKTRFVVPCSITRPESEEDLTPNSVRSSCRTAPDEKFLDAKTLVHRDWGESRQNSKVVRKCFTHLLLGVRSYFYNLHQTRS